MFRVILNYYVEICEHHDLIKNAIDWNGCGEVQS